MSDHLLRWEIRDAETIRGYLCDHPATTLFLLLRQSDGQVKLQGAFIPDGEENELWTRDNAQAAAEKYLTDWLLTVAPTLLQTIWPTITDIADKPITRAEVIEGLRISYTSMLKSEQEKDSTIKGYPDMEKILDYIEQHGLPPK